jgi:hypothetical protein
VVLLMPSLALAQGAAATSGSADSTQAMINERLEEIPSGEEGVNQIMSSLDDRLKLSAEQKKDIRPTIEASLAQIGEIRDRLKAGEITPMAFGMQVQMATQKAAVLIDPVLTEEQRTEYAAMRQEQRREMVKAMQRTRPPASGTAGAN